MEHFSQEANRLLRVVLQAEVNEYDGDTPASCRVWVFRVKTHTSTLLEIRRMCFFAFPPDPPPLQQTEEFGNIHASALSLPFLSGSPFT